MSTKDIVFSAAGGAAPIEGDFTYVWGGYNQGQAGNDGVNFIYQPTRLGTDTWISLGMAAGSSLGIKSNNTLWAWGSNTDGVLGLNIPVAEIRQTPVQVGALSDWAQVSVGSDLVIALKTNGTLWGWGTNNSGQVGDNAKTNRSSPVQIGALSNWAQVAANVTVAGAVKTDNTLWMWGYGFEGSIGNNSNASVSSPVQIGAAVWSKLALGPFEYSVLALRTDGTLWGWGPNSNGELAQGDRVRRSSPVQIGSDSDWADVVVTTSGSVFAIKTSGALWAWGHNANATLGLNVVDQARSSPVQVGALSDWAQIGGAGFNALAVKTDGTLWSWGGSISPANKVLAVSSPVQIGSAINWSSVFTGRDGCWILDASNNAYGFGSGGLNGGLGGLSSGGFVKQPSPVLIGSDEWLTVTASATALGIKGDGSLWSWGINTSGALGINKTTAEFAQAVSPVQIGTDKNWIKVFSRDSGGGFAIKDDNTLWVWGSDSFGQCGLNTNNVARSSPVQIPGSWSSVSNDSGRSIAAIKTDGTLWTWGQNGDGQLGQNNLVTYSSPVQVGALSNWAQVSIGANWMVAVKTDNTLWGWGTSNFGQLNVSKIDRSSPVQIGTGYAYVAAGSSMWLAVKTDGTLWGVGLNNQGQIAQTLSPNRDRSSPVQIGALTNWSKVQFSSSGAAYALKTDGTLWAWGNGASYGLSGSFINRSSPVQIGSRTDWIGIAEGTGRNDAQGFAIAFITPAP
jgi:alpha-tubulin suppressor-like RCC1 family protein